MSSNEGDCSAMAASSIKVPIESCTRVKKIQFSHRWEIENFSYFCYDPPVNGERLRLESARFSPAHNADIKFFLCIYPFDREIDLQKDFIGIYLYMEKPNAYRLSACFRVALLNDKGEIGYLDEDRDQFSQNEYAWGWNFIPRDFLFDPANRLLPNDKLTIFCEITYEVVADMQGCGQEEYAQLHSIEDCVASLWESKALTDLVLLVGKQATEFNVHKSILCQSPVFATMFEFEMFEMTTNKVEMADEEPAVVELFLVFLYTGKCDNLEQFAEPLLQLADKFQVDSLKTYCEHFLSARLSPESVFNLLLLAYRHNAPLLTSKAIDYLGNLRKTTSSVSDDLKSLLSNQPKLFYKMMPALMKLERTTGDDSTDSSSQPHTSELYYCPQGVQSDTWSRTNSSVGSCSHEWVINQISSYDKDFYSSYYYYNSKLEQSGVFMAIESSPFSSANHDQVSFTLKLYPNSDSQFSRDYLSLYLCLAKSQDSMRRIAVNFKASLLNSHGQVCYSKVMRKQLGSTDRKCGWSRFISCMILNRDKANRMMANDRLVIRCEVSYVDGINRPDTVAGHCRPPVLRQLGKDLVQLLDSQLVSDVVLQLDSQSYPAHRVILSSRSPVLAEMLQQLQPPNCLQVVAATDEEKAVFGHFLRFIYGQTSVVEEYAAQLLPLAEKYQVANLKAACEVNLCGKLAPQTATNFLLLADQHNAAHLKAQSMQYISSHASSTLKMDHLKSMLATKPQLLLEVFSTST